MVFLDLKKLLLTVLFVSSSALAQVGTYQSVDEFLAETFIDVPAKSTLWLSKEDRHWLEQELGNSFKQFRVNYWQLGSTTVWFENEIGKEYPITTGIVIEKGRVKKIAVLEYREIRGGEVRYPFFTQQFTGVDLSKPSKKWKINGITGATLSVSAMKKMARRSLLLNSLIKNND